MFLRKALISAAVMLMTASGVMLAQTTNIFPGTGNVGIGTTSPGTLLDVQGGGLRVGHTQTPEAIDLGGEQLIYFNTDGPTVTSGQIIGGLGFYGYGVSHGQIDYRAGKGFELLDVSADGPSSTHAATTYAPLYLSSMYSTGNVGIGTSSPAYSLDVTGKVHSTAGVVYPDGTQQTTAWTGVLCGGDYAEAMNPVGGKKSYEPGDVLVLTTGKESDVEKSSKRYSTTVAGIYATKPGVIGRRQSLVKETESNEVPMAMVGVVPTKVSAENGPIYKGDLLVTSSRAGYAMKGTDRSRLVGAVIGKAMGSLQSGTGMIEVLVTLQ